MFNFTLPPITAKRSLIVPRRFKKNEDSLQIRWRTRRYYFDIFESEFFSTEAEEEERNHGIFYEEDDDDVLLLSCVATIKDSFACLKYHDQSKGIDEGEVLIYFTSPERDEVSRIDWRSLDGTVYADHATSNWDISSEAEEGRDRTSEAKYVCRSRELVEKRKIKDQNKCQACGYQLKVNGVAIIDVHHINPIASKKGVRVTNIEDMICLCPNCHRIVHTSNPPLTVMQVKSLLTMP